LGREYKLYETLLKRTSLTEGKANVVVDTLLESSKTLNRGAIKRQKYNLINEIQKNYDLNEFFNHKLPNYKMFAAFYTLTEIASAQHTIDPDQAITNKVTILEHLTAAKITESKVRDEVMGEFEKADKDVRFLAYKMILENFNAKYNDLHPRQKEILKEFITSVDNKPRLKEFYTAKVVEIKEELTTLNAKTKNKTTQIKINEIINIIQIPAKTAKITDNDLVDLLQYYDLINELETVNEKN
jgi:hypothetical protein